MINAARPGVGVVQGPVRWGGDDYVGATSP
jgi:hypothetical protein